MFRSKRRKELEAKELELTKLKAQISEFKLKCHDIRPEIAFAMLHLEGIIKGDDKSVDMFRKRLAQGEYYSWS